MMLVLFGMVLLVAAALISGDGGRQAERAFCNLECVERRARPRQG